MCLYCCLCIAYNWAWCVKSCSVGIVFPHVSGHKIQILGVCCAKNSIRNFIIVGFSVVLIDCLLALMAIIICQR